MERSEPSLVPEWLRNSGSVSSGGGSAHHFAMSSSQSDISSVGHHARNRISKSTSDFDPPRSAFLDRSSTSNSRRSSTNGSAKHAYSSFSRSHRERDRERDKERSSFGDHWDRDDPIGSILTSRSEKDLRRSSSLISRKQNEVLSRRVPLDLKNSSSGNHVNGNGLVSGGSIGNSIQKAVFEKDFPSLGSDDRQVGADIGRVGSPTLISAVQSLPVGSSALIGGEGWTSALAEVPSVIGSGTTCSSPTVQSIVAPVPSPPSALAGLNMAEALTQAAPRTRAAPQLSVQTQRLEELAIKQSRQLIPVTPSMPKSLALSSSDKSKPKAAVRSGEMNMPIKSVQQQSPTLHPVNQSLVGGHPKSDVPKVSHGNFLVLKPGWENGVSPSQKDIASPTSNASRAATSQLAASLVSSAPLKTANLTKLSSGDRKSTSSSLVSGFNVEKRPSLSQTQSRNDFFNHLKKKTSTNTAVIVPVSASVSSATATCENSSEVNKVVESAPTSRQAINNGTELTSNGNTCEEVQRFSEEEAAFLKSLGWEENAGEDEGLTEEEINAFYQEYMKVRPSLKVCRSVEQKLIESNVTSFGGTSSELSSSDSGTEN